MSEQKVFQFSLLKQSSFYNKITDGVVKFGSAFVDLSRFTTIIYEYVEKKQDDEPQCANIYIAQSDQYEPSRDDIEATKTLAFSAMPLQKVNDFDNRLRWLIDGRMTLREYIVETKQLEGVE